MNARGKGIRRPILIVTEGATERGYLNAIRDHARTRDIRKIIDAKGGGGIVEALSRTNLDAFAQVWIVLDAESHPHNELQRVAGWVAAAADPQRFRVVVTSPRFEAWLLAHFEVPTGSGRQMEERLKAACGFRKPQLPPELPLRDWQAAAGNLEEFDCRAPLVTDDRDSCAVCQPGSAMIHIVRLVLGEPG